MISWCAKRSVHEVACTCGVNLFKSESSTLVQDALCLEALVLVIAVRGHAGSEGLEIKLAELVKDVLAGGAFIFSGEAVLIRSIMNLLDDSLINKS